VHITHGFLYTTLLRRWVGPVLIARFSPRKLMLAGTALTAIGAWQRLLTAPELTCTSEN
jgi:hypothetical protein